MDDRSICRMHYTFSEHHLRADQMVPSTPVLLPKCNACMHAGQGANVGICSVKTSCTCLCLPSAEFGFLQP